MIETLEEKAKWVRSPDFLAALALFFLSLFFFYDLIEGRHLLTERDLGPYFIPPRFYWVESIKHGSFPFWNPYQFSGHPFFANPQHGMLYPLNGLFFIFPFDVAFNVIIILHFFLGGLFTYLFLRDLRVDPTGALISGLIFMLSGYLLSVHSLLTILLSSIWTPLIMLFFRRAINGQGIKHEMLTAIFITISFLGGGVEIVYGNFVVLLIMAILSPGPNSTSPRSANEGGWGFRNYFITMSSRNPLWIRVRSLLIISILFLFLSAIQLFPFIELFQSSVRGSGMSYQEATTWSFAPKDLLLFFLPDAYGYFLDMKNYWVSQCWFKTLYLGGLPFILSLIFFLGPSSRHSPSVTEDRTKRFEKERKLFLVLMLLSIFLSLGRYNPLYPLVFKYAPFFDGIRYPAKFLYIFILTLAIAAGLGFQKLSEYSRDNEKKKLKHLVLILSLLSGSFLLFSALGHQQVEHFLKLRGIDFPEFNYLSVNLHHAQRVLFYFTLFFLILRAGYELRWKRWVKVLLLVFLTADLFGNMGFYGKEKTEEYFQKTKALEMISSDMAFFRLFSTAKTISLDATVMIGESSPLSILKEKSVPSLNLLFQLHDIWGIEVIRVKRVDDLYKALTGSPSISATHLIDLYGVKYVTSVTPLDENDKFELIYARLENLQGKREDLLKENTIKLYKNRNPLPRAWLVNDYRVMDSNAILSLMVQKQFNPREEVLIEETPPFLPFGQKDREGSGGKAEIISESDNRLVLRVEGAGECFLVLSDTYYPGWKAFVDGKETKIYRADYTFRAIPLSAGAHRVEFVYDPMSFKLGAGVTLLGILGCIGIGWVARRRSSSRSGDPRSRFWTLGF